MERSFFLYAASRLATSISLSLGIGTRWSQPAHLREFPRKRYNLSGASRQIRLSGGFTHLAARPLNPTTEYTPRWFINSLRRSLPCCLDQRQGQSTYPLSAATALNRGARTNAVFYRNRNESSLEGMIYFPDINHTRSRGPCVVTVLRMCWG